MRSLPSNFPLQRPGPPGLIIVGTEWCGHCASLKPLVPDIERALGRRVPVYWVDGDTITAEQFRVDGYPTVLYKSTARETYRYEGPRTPQAIARFVANVDRNA